MQLTHHVRKTVVTAAVDTPAAELAELMRDEAVGSVIITDDERPVGIVTDRDLVVKVFADGIVPPSVRAADVMTEGVVTIEADADALEMCRRMADASVRRMPVVEDGELVGIVTLDDMVQLLAEELQQIAGVIAAESPPY